MPRGRRNSAPVPVPSAKGNPPNRGSARLPSDRSHFTPEVAKRVLSLEVLSPTGVVDPFRVAGRIVDFDKSKADVLSNQRHDVDSAHSARCRLKPVYVVM